MIASNYCSFKLFTEVLLFTAEDSCYCESCWQATTNYNIFVDLDMVNYTNLRAEDFFLLKKTYWEWRQYMHIYDTTPWRIAYIHLSIKTIKHMFYKMIILWWCSSLSSVLAIVDRWWNPPYATYFDFSFDTQTCFGTYCAIFCGFFAFIYVICRFCTVLQTAMTILQLVIIVELKCCSFLVWFRGVFEQMCRTINPYL